MKVESIFPTTGCCTEGILEYGHNILSQKRQIGYALTKKFKCKVCSHACTVDYFVQIGESKNVIVKVIRDVSGKESMIYFIESK